MIASSTRMPVASTKPNSDSMFIVTPQAGIHHKVPHTDTNTPAAAHSAAEVLRNSINTDNTSKKPVTP